MRAGSTTGGSSNGVLTTFLGTQNSVISFQYTTYQSSGEEFNGVTINKTNGAKVVLASGNVFMNNSSSVGPVILTFISGIIETGNNIWVYMPTSNAGVVGASTTCYVNGIMGRGMNSSAAAYKKMEIGDANGYRPITVYNATGSGSGHYVWAKLVTGNPNTGTSIIGSGLDSITTLRYYQIGYVKGASGADTMQFNQFAPTYNWDDNIAEGVSGLMVAYSYNNRANWYDAGPPNHITDFLDPPTAIQSSVISPAFTIRADSVFYVCLAWGPSSGPIPTKVNIQYGATLSNTLDFWQATSSTPTPLVVRIHGGGLTSGSKADVSTSMITSLLAAGISFISINYRLTPEVIIPQHYLDCARAIQFMRYHAKDYNINPNLIGATGSSAGGLISTWLAMHNDLADPNNADSVLRMSSRLSCIANWGAQTSIDPAVCEAWIGPMVLQFTTYFGGSVFGLSPDSLSTPTADSLYVMASPVNYVTADDPPVWMWYDYEDPPTTSSEAIHHVEFGTHLRDTLAKFNIPCTLLYPSVYSGNVTQSSVDFFVKYLITNPLPVEMDIFTAKSDGQKVSLQWITKSEVNNQGWEIQRALIDNNAKTWVKIGFIKGHGNSNVVYEYAFDDKSINQNGNYSYRLKQMDNNGQYKYSKEVEVETGIIFTYSLKQNYPNPFNPTTIIQYSVPKEGNVELKVFNTIGQEVMCLVNENKEAGNYSVNFKASGLSSGIYFYRLKTGDYTDIKKMILVK